MYILHPAVFATEPLQGNYRVLTKQDPAQTLGCPLVKWEIEVDV